MGLFGKGVACGCAEEDGEFFFVTLRHAERERRVDVLSAVHGREDDAALLKALAGRYGVGRVWVPVRVASVAQLSDIRIARIDDGDGLVKRADMQRAMEAQMRQLEADKKGDYVRSLSCVEENGRRRWVGGSIPRAAAEATFETWRRLGFSKPCVASRHVALANLFLALHPDAASDDGLNRILSGWQEGVDIFCYLRGNALIDCGSSVMAHGAAFDSHMEALGGWAGDFAGKHKVSEKDGFRAIVVSASGNPCPDNFQPDGNLAFWTPDIDGGGPVRFATDAARNAANSHSELALRAIGLALHGA